MQQNPVSPASVTKKEVWGKWHFRIGGVFWNVRPSDWKPLVELEALNIYDFVRILSNDRVTSLS